MVTPDVFVNENISLFHHPILTEIMKFFSFVGSAYVMFFLFLFLFVYSLYRRRKNHSALLVFAPVLSILIGVVLKFLFRRIRPEDIFNTFKSIDIVYSFPSNHAIASMVFSLCLFYTFRASLKSRLLSGVFKTICIIFPLAVGFSRIYLRAHWLTDVLAGFLIGFICFFFLRVVLKDKES